MSPTDRAHSLLRRIAAGHPDPLRAAEEVDRLQPALARLGSLEEIRGEVARLCTTTPSGPSLEAWLTLVGAFDLAEHVPAVAEAARRATNPAAARVCACRILPRLRGPAAARDLLDVLTQPGDPRVRTAAAEALAAAGNREVRSELAALLEEDLPAPVWRAVAATVERL